MLIFTALIFTYENMFRTMKRHKQDIEIVMKVTLTAKNFIEIIVEIENDRDRAIFFQSSL